MSHLAPTTTQFRNPQMIDLDLDQEALDLARRVTQRIRQPTPTKPQPIVADEYEPQDTVEKTKKIR